jgi:hypothetical protein
MIKYLKALFIASPFAILVAPSAASAAGYAGVFHVTAVTIEGGIYIHTDGSIGNPDGCSANDTIAIPLDSPNRDAIISMAYMAMSSGRRLSMWVSGCAQNVSRTVPLGYHFSIVQ